jgi:ribosomal-protein-alanine N-acetyltransferase
VAAVQLYESLGFATVARRRGYYPDNKEDALVMWNYDLNA